jgi:tRNA-2-methylthio-N6-dimethylallyladenosine synthase
VAEAKKLADEGCLEVTLLGQTVNSYRHTEGGRTTRLSDLLYRLHDIPGLARLKFVTNFPKDMTDDLLQAVRDLPKCSPYLHVPAQSGSNAVLKRMKRGYTVEEYRDMLARVRATIPDAAVTSDFIVGFCRETDEDFDQTVDLVRQSRFKNSFIFKYSERPGTKAPALWPDDIPEEVKRRRNNELLAVQNQISEEDNQTFIGRTVAVLVEGPSKRAQKFDRTDEPDGTANAEFGIRSAESPQGIPHSALRTPNSQITQLVGRTPDDRIVVFQGNRRQIGQILPVTILDCTPMTLLGAVVTHEVGPEVYSLA